MGRAWLLIVVLGVSLTTAWPEPRGRTASAAGGRGGTRGLTAVRITLGLHGPRGIAVDGRGLLYVADGDDTSVRVLKIAPAGRVLATWAVGHPAPINAVLTGIAVDRRGAVYVIDNGVRQLLKLAPDGRIIARWPLAVSIDGARASDWSVMLDAQGVAVDRQGQVYVTLATDSQVLKFSASGRPLARWGKRDPSGVQLLTSGDRPGEFSNPAGVAVDARGNVYVADLYNRRVQELSPTGTVLAVWPQHPRPDAPWMPGQLSLPMGITLDPAGDVYVVDYGNGRLQKLGPTGRPLAHWSLTPMPAPGVAVGGQGAIYLTDADNRRVVKLSPTGQKLAEWH